MPAPVKSSPLVYLFGSDGQLDAAYNNAAANGNSVDRDNFRNHVFQRVVKTGDSGNPSFDIQMSMITVNPTDEDWTKIATLDDTTPVVIFSNVHFPRIRAVRTGITTTKAKVRVMSSNSRVDSQ